jgi:hypothetical protein
MKFSVDKVSAIFIFLQRLSFHDIGEAEDLGFFDNF